MRKKRDSAERESQIASGWTVSSIDGQPDVQIATPEQTASSSVTTEAAEAEQRTDVSNVTLVLYGVFGGMYLLYTAGWFLIAQYFVTANDAAASASGLVGGVLQVIIYWAAALAPAAWFVVVYALSRGKKPWFLPVWLMLGLVVLLPLPLFTTGGAS